LRKTLYLKTSGFFWGIYLPTLRTVTFLSFLPIFRTANNGENYRCNLIILLFLNILDISSDKLGRKPCPLEIPVQFACSRPPFPQLSVSMMDAAYSCSSLWLL
jgi:hypothetical protein